MAKKKSLALLTEAKLRKKHPNGIKGDDLMPSEEHIWLPTRCITLNGILGGGIPYGKILEIYGYESTGKSLIAYDFAYVTQALGGTVLWGDIEQAFQTSWAEQQGVSMDNLELFTGNNTIENWGDWIIDWLIFTRSELQSNEPILIVVDSIAAWEALANTEDYTLSRSEQMGNVAKAIYKMYRRRQVLFEKYGACVIMINQIRNKMGASRFESNETTPAGNATKFYASQRLNLGKSKQIKGYMSKGGWKDKTMGDKAHKIGQNINLRIEKNKVAPPRPTIKTQMYFLDEKEGYVGLDRYMGLPEMLRILKIVTKRGQYWKYKGKNIARGNDGLLEELRNNPKLRKRLIRASGINTISKTRKKIKNTTYNYYPVNLKKSKQEE